MTAEEEKLKALAEKARDSIGRNRPQDVACLQSALTPAVVIELLLRIGDLEADVTNYKRYYDAYFQ